MYSDPFGLIKWEGEFVIRSATYGLGIALGIFNLESECVQGKKSLAQVKTWGIAADIGLYLSQIEGTVSLEDGRTSLAAANLNPFVLEGRFELASLLPTVGPVGGPVAVTLGDARGHADAKGLDLSVLSMAIGKSRLEPFDYPYFRWEECDCEN